MKIRSLNVIKDNVERIKEIAKSKIRLSTKSGKKRLSTEEVVAEIEKNRNHSWIRETFRDNAFANAALLDLENGISKEEFKKKYKEHDYVQFKYFVDNEISYLDFIYESFQTAKALKAQGFGKDDELLICVDRSPEYTYLLGAASLLGTQINVFSEKFDHEYIKNGIIYYWDDRLTKEQIEKAKSLGIIPRGNDYDNYLRSVGIEPIKRKKFVFYTDTKHNNFQDIVEELDDVNFISIRFDRSLQNNKSYLENSSKYYYCEEKKYESDRVRDFDSFLNDKDKYVGKVEAPSNLDTPFTISYSSGTTGNPKGIRHSNRHYIMMARYHDTEVSGIPSVGKMSTYINIPSYSNSFISSGFSDNTIKGGVLMLDPIDTSEYFKTGLRVNDANMNIGSVSSLVKLALRSYLHPDEFDGYYLRNSLFNFVAGEELLPGEEKIINSFLKKVKAGTDVYFDGKKIKLPFSLVTASVAGGTCELGSGFLALMRSYSNKLPRKNKKDPVGMTAYKCYDIKILREDGTYADPYELGNITVNSDCTMLGYNHDSEATENFYIYDAYGIRRANMGVWGYLDEKDRLTMKDRKTTTLSDDMSFIISDSIVKDTKNICSAKVVKTDSGEYIAFIIYQPNMRISKEKADAALKYRVLNDLGISIRTVEVNPDEYYPLTKSLKVDKKKLKKYANDFVNYVSDIDVKKLLK